MRGRLKHTLQRGRFQDPRGLSYFLSQCSVLERQDMKRQGSSAKEVEGYFHFCRTFATSGADKKIQGASAYVSNKMY